MASKKMDALVDQAVELTFPASDPPSFMAGITALGSPDPDIVREPPSTELASMPGEDADEIERRIRERAYYLWEEEGRPEGRADEHWRVAQEVEIESAKQG